MVNKDIFERTCKEMSGNYENRRTPGNNSEIYECERGGTTLKVVEPAGREGRGYAALEDESGRAEVQNPTMVFAKMKSLKVETDDGDSLELNGKSRVGNRMKGTEIEGEPEDFYRGRVEKTSVEQRKAESANL